MPRWLYQEVGSVTEDTPPWWTPVFRVWKGFFGIWNLNKIYGVGFGKRQWILTRNEILQLYVPKNWDFPKCKHRMHDFFACKLGMREIIPLRRNMQINQTHIKGYLLSNLSVECALLAFYCFFFWKPKRLQDFRGKGAGLHKVVVMGSTHTSTVILCCITVLCSVFYLTTFFQSIGRGLKNGENFELLYKLAEKMNAAGKIKTANNIQCIYLSYGTDKENLVSNQEIHSLLM